MSGRGQQQREALFDMLAEVFGQRSPDHVGLYPCPICLTLHDRGSATDGRLTLEHVPPRRLGGRPIVLTCKRCNSDAGSSVDIDWINQSLSFDFLHSRPATVRAEIGVGIVRQRATIQSTGDGMLILGVPSAGPPERPDEVASALQSTHEPKFNVRLEHHHSPVSAKVAVLRSAYLLTLRKLGWGYILRQVFDPLRAQLVQPAESTIDVPVQANPAMPMSTPTVLLATEPAPYRCVLVSFGQHVAFLPAPMQAGPFFASVAQRFREFTSTGSAAELRGSTLDGTGPDMLFDRVPGATEFPGAEYG
ncbi:MAG: hypothetical protein HY828_21200 [Actinobacteria bacterium]|nr:hypothetical protein [Actinomycetota bacterium]